MPSPRSHPHPDLTYPLLPDAEEDLPLPLSHGSSSSFDRRRVDQGGMNLRNIGDDYQWPEAGPSSSGGVSTRGANDLAQGQGGEATVGPFGAKAVAAMTGAMATSLLMTPFDVLKTRLQTVQPLPRSTAATTSSSIPQSIPLPSAGSDCCQTTMLTSTSSSSRLTPGPTTNPLTCLNSGPVIESGGSARGQNVTFTSMRPSAAPAAAPSGCLYPSKWAGIWGEAITFEQALSRGVIGSAYGPAVSASGSNGALLVFPTTSLQETLGGSANESRSVATGFWSEIAAVRRETGIKGLWKGVGTAITMGIPSSAIYMLGYEHLLIRISPYFTGTSNPALNASSISTDPTTIASAAVAPVIPNTKSLTASLTPAPLIAGSLARTLSATVISPIEMFRTRLQALPSVERGTPTYASTARDMTNLVQSKGVTILWRGLGPTLWRDVPFSGIYWASFELLKSRLVSPSSPLPPLTPITTSFISGFVSGTISALVTQPFDVLKTRRQVFNPSPECATPRAATVPLALHVIRTEGVKALFAGMSARVGKVAPACGLMIACYEGVGRWLGGAEGGKRAL